VLDYDGTLCTTKDRFKPLSQKITSELTRILSSGFILGIITGRGKSAREQMQHSIPKKYWSNVIVGYYNGADIGDLSDNTLPLTTGSINHSLKQIHTHLKSSATNHGLKLELRPKQLTVEVTHKNQWTIARSIIQSTLLKLNINNILVLESSHSMDIVTRPEVSKLNILPICHAKAKSLKLATSVLCIGDKGRWPGNDFELLSTKFSLSVDEVSPSPESCWNISAPGIKGVDATVAYLQSLEFANSYFNIRNEK
jgi:hydroxymethylpyrimidine pyrophosphatase-like HAD family hydrolase